MPWKTRAIAAGRGVNHAQEERSACQRSAFSQQLRLEGLSSHAPGQDQLIKTPRIERSNAARSAYNLYMHAFLGQLPALIAAAVLALPPSFCCFPGGEATKATPPKSCCQKSSGSSHQQPAPQCPQGGCCCERHAVAPPDIFQRPDAATFAIFPAASTFSEQTAPQAAVATTVILPTGPPLHVLNCVWLI